MSSIEDLSNGKETIPIPLLIEDKTSELPNFEYITTSIGGPGINFSPQEALYQGCQCKFQRCGSDCPCVRRYGNTYNHEGHLIVTQEDEGYCQPVFECNSKCSCANVCPNRVSQRGVCAKVEVFSSGGKGWGVRTRERIAKNTFVFEYAGELLSLQEAERRTKECKNFANYIFVLREHIAQNQILRTHVDAYHYGNVARFVNHSCDPNMYIFPVRVNSPVPKLALFALRDIAAGEELSFDYSGHISGPQHPSCLSLQHGHKTPCMTSSNAGLMKCACGSQKCQRYLPYDSTLYDNTV